MNFNQIDILTILMVFSVSTVRLSLELSVDPTAQTTSETWYKGKLTVPCAQLRVRRNILSLTQNQVNQYIEALKQLYADGTIERYTLLHSDNYFQTHNQPFIFWWHRYFIYLFENEIRKINPNLTIPYWDASEDWKEPHKSIVLSDNYFGGNGNNVTKCIENSFLKDVKVHLFGTRTCIKREFSGDYSDTIPPWTPTESIISAMNVFNKTDEFRRWLEDRLHFFVHSGIGNLIGDLNSPDSPIDPIFFLHHSNMDRWIYTWQLSKPERFDMINGIQKLFSENYINITRYTQLVNFPVQIKDILKIEERPYCYTYDYLPLERLSKI